MVIGNGLMAQTFLDFKNNQNVLIFASGVSNSMEYRQTEFNREFKLLKKTIIKYSKPKLIYFSTLSILDTTVNNSLYIEHKLNLEEYIKTSSLNYLILRVSNAVGPQENIHTIMNYLVNAVKSQTRIDIWLYAERNLIDKDDVKLIVNHLLKENSCNKIVNIATNESILVTRILKQIEVYLQKKAIINLISKGNKLDIDVNYIQPVLKKIEATNGKGIAYINYLLKKYY